MVIEIKKSKYVFVILGIIAFLCVFTSIVIILSVEDKKSIPYILMTPIVLFLVILTYFIILLIRYIKSPYSYLIKFEEEYIVFSNEKEVYYKAISYVLTDEYDNIKYFVINPHNRIGFNHKSKDVNKFLIDLLKSKNVKVIDSHYKNNANRCVAKIYWIKKENGGKITIPFTNMYAPQIVLEIEERNAGIGWSAFVINKEISEDRVSIADILLLSEKYPYPLNIGQKFELYEGNRLVATGKVIRDNIN